MATGWAVGSAATLALVLAFAFPANVAAAAGLAIAGAAWAYGIAMTAHGSKGALAGLAVPAAVGALVAGVRLARSEDLAVRVPQGAALLVALLTLYAIQGELRARRGAVRMGDALLVGAPGLLLALPLVWLA